MAAVTLRIIEPANGTVYAGPASVRFHGAVDTAPPPAPLFFQWYSSLAIAPAPAQPGDPLSGALDFTRTLASAGSYVISLAARDVASSAPADLKNVQNGGLTGGPKPPAACVIHVLVAEIVEPAAGASLSRAAVRLAAKAPLLWGDLKPPAFAPTAAKSPAYDAIDRLQYRWRFTPSGAPAGRASADFVPTALTFDPNDALANGPVLRYTGPAPAGLALGAYQVTLRVEDKTNPALGHEAARAVSFTA